MSQLFEGLEDRRLLSSTLAGGVLTVTGTANADRVLVTATQDKVYVIESTVTPGTDGGRPTITTTRNSFNRADVHSIEANLGAGNDQILVSDFSFFRTGSTATPIPATINGEAGNDTIITGRGDDTLNGGDGNDLLSGDGGKDHLNGGAGDDVILGGGGDDTINGDSGNDFLAGGGGNDTLNGDDGRDRLDGGRGDDILNGGAGNDAIFAVDGAGTDKIDGGTDEADTNGDVAIVDQGDTVTNVEHVRTFRPRPTTTWHG